MSTYNLQQPHYGSDFVAAAIEGAGDLMHSLARKLRVEHARRKAAAELHAMSDQALSDMGISRGEIEQVVVKGRRG